MKSFTQFVVSFFVAATAAGCVVGAGGAAGPAGPSDPAGPSAPANEYDNVPRTGGTSVDTADAAQAGVSLESVISSGQVLWYRFDPAVPKGRCNIKLTAQQLMQGTYKAMGSVRITLTDDEMTQRALSGVTVNKTYSDGVFDSGGGGTFLVGPATFLKVEMAESDAAPIHFRLTVCSE